MNRSTRRRRQKTLVVSVVYTLVLLAVAFVIFYAASNVMVSLDKREADHMVLVEKENYNDEFLKLKFENKQGHVKTFYIHNTYEDHIGEGRMYNIVYYFKATNPLRPNREIYKIKRIFK